MSNEMFLKQSQNIYESLRYFSIENNLLSLHTVNGPRVLALSNVSLASINQNLFLLKPIEIFHTLRTLELLYSKELTSNDIEFLKSYVANYLTLNDKALEGIEDNYNELNGFKIPIYLSYDPNFINNPASTIIQSIINNHSDEIENSKGKHPKLVLVNSNYKGEEENDDLFLSQAGFSTLILIALTVATTCLYIAGFIVGN